MMPKTVVSMLVLLVVIGGGFTAHFNGNRAYAAVGMNAAVRAHILASTIQIEMFDTAWIESGARHRHSASGLGTVVQDKAQRFIITHNHWSLLAEEVNGVEFRNTAGELLLVVDGPTFRSLVRYQDGGTLLLDAPPQLQGVVPAPLGDVTRLVAGEDVWLVQRDPGEKSGLGVARARLEQVDTVAVPGRMQLLAQRGAVAPGDSGGGVWHDGKLVGNLWTIIMVQVQVPGGHWSGKLGQWPTGLILAGIQPLGGASGVSRDDLVSDLSGDEGYERGLLR